MGWRWKIFIMMIIPKIFENIWESQILDFQGPAIFWWGVGKSRVVWHFGKISKSPQSRMHGRVVPSHDLACPEGLVCSSQGGRDRPFDVRNRLGTNPEQTGHFRKAKSLHIRTVTPAGMVVPYWGRLHCTGFLGALRGMNKHRTILFYPMISMT